MRARAPGKLVLSGAYSVLHGAPALVSAVNRYAFATIGAPATFESEEVRAFLDTLPPEQRPPHPQLDAAALRTNVPGGSRKLGLGSSAALLSAAIMVVLTDLEQKEPLAEDIFWRALDAHRRAQGGGSGIDVAASVFGRVLRFELTEGQPSWARVRLPPDLVVEVWAMTEAASTSDFVRRVFSLEAREPSRFQRLFSAQAEAAHAAAAALEAGASLEFIRALGAQALALRALGEASQVPIVLPVLDELRPKLPEQSAWLPSGAGGGDVTLYVGTEPSPSSFRSAAAQANLARLELELDAEGVALADEPSERGTRP